MKETWAQWGWWKWGIPLRSEILRLFQLMPKGVKCGRRNHGGNKPRTPRTLLPFILCLGCVLRRRRKRKKKKKCYGWKTGLPRGMCMGHRRMPFSPLPMYHLTCFFPPWGFVAGRPATWETKSLEHQLMLKNLLSPTWPPFFSIPNTSTAS